VRRGQEIAIQQHQLQGHRIGRQRQHGLARALAARPELRALGAIIDRVK
jgi:hypothetical protein